MITASRLETFLGVMTEQSADEWRSGRGDTGSYWYVKYQASSPPFVFLIEFNEEMLYVQYLFRDFRIRSSCWLALYRILLRLNEELSLVKFGLTSFGNVTLMGELPATQFSLDTFQNLLRLMVHSLEELYWEIGIVAEAEELAPLLTGQETTAILMDRQVSDLARAIQIEDRTALNV